MDYQDEFHNYLLLLRAQALSMKCDRCGKPPAYIHLDPEGLCGDQAEIMCVECAMGVKPVLVVCAGCWEDLDGRARPKRMRIENEDVWVLPLYEQTRSRPMPRPRPRRRGAR